MENLKLQHPIVLIVDDSSTIRTTVKVYLKPFQNQMEVVFAVDGFEALRKIQEVHPSLIIADVLMPRLSGYQLCAMIKTNPQTNKIPFFMLSSKDGEVDKAIARHNGADGYLIKPFTKPILQNLIKGVLKIENDIIS